MKRPPLLLLHGPGQNPTAWQGVVDALDPDRAMFAPWVLGLKPTQHQPFSMAAAAADIANTMELRGMEVCDLVGFSLGGMVALRAAADYPALIRKLVVVSTPVTPATKALKRSRRLLALAPQGAFQDVPKEQVLRALDALIDLDADVAYNRITAGVLAVVAAGDAELAAAAGLLAEAAHAEVKTIPARTPDLLAEAPQALAQLIEAFTA
jgi:pimeloyl-ACP methyl ester carboxylesterase